jgi:hypothetical protein
MWARDVVLVPDDHVVRYPIVVNIDRRLVAPG